MTRGAELRDAKHARKIDMVRAGQVDDTELSKLDIRNPGWKDKFWTVVLATPFIGAVVPGLQSYMLEGLRHHREVSALGAILLGRFGAVGLWLARWQGHPKARDAG